MSDDTPAPAPVRVWDLPTRLVHWLMVLCVAASWWTGEQGHLEWHRWSGYTLLGLVTFRIYWGFFGSSTARFREFVRGPRVIMNYLRGGWSVALGHNPLGALSVLALLVVLLLQVSLGLFAVDVDGIESGPLALYVSFETGRAAAEWHEWVFNLFICLVGVHIVAIAWYRFAKKEKLTAAMFHGKRAYTSDLPPVQGASALSLVIGVVLATAFTWAVSQAFQIF